MKFLRYADLKSKGVTFTRVHLNRLEAAGQFPRKVPLGANTVAWIEAEVDDWIAERIARRGQGA
jgi:prophage regulatory protein